jgi:GR25 family glycosyltransferase involved in LPS biosynthesis
MKNLDAYSSADSALIRRIFPNPEYRTTLPKIYVYYSYVGPHQIPRDAKSVLIDAEPHTSFIRPLSDYTLVLTTKQELASQNSNAIYVPAWSLIGLNAFHWSMTDLLHRSPPSPKTKFCAYMYSNCDTQRFNGVKVREAFFKALHARKPVDALGKCNHNVSLPPTRDSPDWFNQAIELYRPYKFVLAFENMLDVAGYVSEKVITALLAGCVPVYSGNRIIKEQLNPQCMINLDDFDSPEACIEYILDVDGRPGLYASYVSASIITPERLAQYAGWHFGTQAFFRTVFRQFPEFQRTPYVPIPNRLVPPSDPTRPVKVIHLERSKDRWPPLVEQMRKHPELRYEAFPAVEGKLFMQQYAQWIDPSWMRDYQKRSFLPGEIGIYLSTMELYTQLVQDTQNDWYGVLEDDVILKDSLKPFEAYVDQAPVDWDMIFLGIVDEWCTPNTKANPDLLPFVRLETATCMPSNFAFLVRKRAAQFFLNFAFPILRPIDEFHRNFFANVNAYAYLPVPVGVNLDPTASTIR